MAVVYQDGLVIFRAVDDALLQGGVDLTRRHRGRGAAHVVNHFNRSRGALGADFQAVQVVRGFRRAVLGGVDRTGTGIKPANRDKAVVTGGVEDFLHRFAVIHDVEIVLGRFEHIWQ